MDTFLTQAALDRLLQPSASTFNPADAIFLYDSLPEQPRFSFNFGFKTPRVSKSVGDDTNFSRVGAYNLQKSGGEVEIWDPTDEQKRWKIKFNTKGYPKAILVDIGKPAEIDLGIVTITAKISLWGNWSPWKTPEPLRGGTEEKMKNPSA